MKNVRTAFVLLSALALTGSALAQDRTATQPSLITVTGNGNARVDPDMATVRVGVQSEGRTALAAQNQTNTVSRRIFDAIVKLGIDRKDIQTSTLSLFPVYGQPAPDRPNTQVVIGYRAVSTLSVRVMDLNKVGPVVDAAVNAGANEIQGVEFGLRDESAARRIALKNAVAQARDKAEAIAEALGVRLTEVFEVNEGGYQVMPMPMMARGAMMDSAAAVVAPGQVEVGATVTIRFRFSK